MKITAGLPFKHIFTLPEYASSSGWSITGKLSDADGSYDLAASLFESAGEKWTLSIPSATTTDYDTGDVTLYLIATKDALEELAYEIPCVIAPLGEISHARQMVTLLEAATKQLATKKYAKLTTPEGESIELDREGVEQQLAKYHKQLAAEQSAAAGSGVVRTIQARFS